MDNLDVAQHRPPNPSQTAGPFSASSVLAILRTVLKQGKKPGPTEIAQLTYGLNLVHGTFVFAQQVANDSKTAAGRVLGAIYILQRFFELRRNTWAAPGVLLSADTIAAEAKLFQKFSDFEDAMCAHSFGLDMDAGVLMPPITKWHHIAVPVAGLFRAALAPNNPGVRFGPTNDGPLPRFLAAVLPQITGETMTATAVGKHLRDRAKGRAPKSALA